MIEMSVEKETVLPDDTKVNSRGHLQPQQLTECTDNLNNAPKSAEAAMATSGKPGTTSICSVTAFIGSGMLMDNKTRNIGLTSSCGNTGREELEAKVAGVPFQPKNGLQQLAQEPQQRQQQPSQPQRLNKRRNTMNVGFKYPGFGKRRRRANSESDPVLPTNFLLGGNIFDPLNLNSLLDEEVNRAINAETPKSSPLPAKSRDPVEILIPRDITDPLNLNSSRADAGILASPLKSRKRHRNRHHGGGGSVATVATQADASEPERGKGSEGCTAVATGKAPGAASVLPEAPREGAVLLNLTALLGSPQPDELNISVNSKGTVVLPVLPQGPAESGPQLVPPPAAPPFQPQSSRQRKRRRASSRSESVTPSPLARKPGGDKGQRPGPVLGRPPQTSHPPASGAGGGRSGQTHPRCWRKQQKFQYGNYNKYYGYRNPGWSEDPRVRVLQPEWFRGKTVLDLGCNTGHLTLSIAKNWQPAHIVGLDIDGALIHAARQNIRHYLSEVQAKEARCAARDRPSGDKGQQKITTEGQECNNGGAVKEDQETNGPVKAENKMESRLEVLLAKEGSKEALGPADTFVSLEIRDMQTEEHVESFAQPNATLAEAVAAGHPFPVSLKISRGPIAAPPLPDAHPVIPGEFPANVSFVRGNYVLDSDTLLQTQQPEYDVILCLSVTKWVHLNWGDRGLQRLFQRVFRHLRPGGLFILEPQPWASYGKRKKLTDTIFKNYHNIRFKPDQFSTYLTSEVGFSSYELVGTPKSSSRGFQRPIYLFRKGPSSHRE